MLNVYTVAKARDNKLKKYGLIMSHIQYSIILWAASSVKNVESIFKSY